MWPQRRGRGARVGSLAEKVFLLEVPRIAQLPRRAVVGGRVARSRFRPVFRGRVDARVEFTDSANG